MWKLDPPWKSTLLKKCEFGVDQPPPQCGKNPHFLFFFEGFPYITTDWHTPDSRVPWLKGRTKNSFHYLSCSVILEFKSFHTKTLIKYRDNQKAWNYKHYHWYCSEGIINIIIMDILSNMCMKELKGFSLVYWKLINIHPSLYAWF